MSPDPESTAASASPTRRRLIIIALLSWLTMVGTDFFLHAGLLASLYLEPSAFLLPPEQALRLIPVGYLSFFILAALLVWLMARLEITGWRAGLWFGLVLGGLIWGALILGLLSVSTADGTLLAGWFFGQTMELGIAGAVAGRGLSARRILPLALTVAVFVLIAIAVTVVLQSAGVFATNIGG